MIAHKKIYQTLKKCDCLDIMKDFLRDSRCVVKEERYDYLSWITSLMSDREEKVKELPKENKRYLIYTI